MWSNLWNFTRINPESTTFSPIREWLARLDKEFRMWILFTGYTGVQWLVQWRRWWAVQQGDSLVEPRTAYSASTDIGLVAAIQPPTTTAFLNCSCLSIWLSCLIVVFWYACCTKILIDFSFSFLFIRSPVLWTVDLMFCACFFLLFFPTHFFRRLQTDIFETFPHDVALLEKEALLCRFPKSAP